MQFFQPRLVIEQFDLRGSARHEEINHASSRGREVRKAGQSVRFDTGIGERIEKRGVQERPQRGDADAGGHAAEEMAACQ